MISYTCVAPVNIAVIKYWGKKDEQEIIPLNDSISVTLDTSCMHTKTTVVASPEFDGDSFTLNNEEQTTDSIRFQNCLEKIRNLAAKSENAETASWSRWPVKIVSENNFPTGAGLASSASGFACLVYALAGLYKLDINSEELSAIARRGSGSACRSLFGGFVRWSSRGNSCARPIVAAEHWPELRILIAVVTAKKKAVGSTEGMRRSVETSTLLQYRIKEVLPQRLEDMHKAIEDKNFAAFAELTMKDSNQFHAVCLDTYPPLFYMNSTSQAIVELVHNYNKLHGATKVAYTFDAGPNAVLFMLDDTVNDFASVFHFAFAGSKKPEQFFRGQPLALHDVPKDAEEKLIPAGSSSGSVDYVIHCTVGSGPVSV